MTNEQLAQRMAEHIHSIEEEQFNIGHGDGWASGSTGSVYNPLRTNPDYDRGYEAGYVVGKKGRV